MEENFGVLVIFLEFHARLPDWFDLSFLHLHPVFYQCCFKISSEILIRNNHRHPPLIYCLLRGSLFYCILVKTKEGRVVPGF